MVESGVVGGQRRLLGAAVLRVEILKLGEFVVLDVGVLVSELFLRKKTTCTLTPNVLP